MVIAIIGVLVALLLPAVQTARESARRTQCTNHLKQHALGCINFESQRGHIPKGNYATGTFPEGGNTSWMFVALGYIEAGNLYDQVVSSGNLTNAVNRGILPAAPKIIRCPSDAFETRQRPALELCRQHGPDLQQSTRRLPGAVSVALQRANCHHHQYSAAPRSANASRL